MSTAPPRPPAPGIRGAAGEYGSPAPPHPGTTATVTNPYAVPPGNDSRGSWDLYRGIMIGMGLSMLCVFGGFAAVFSILLLIF
jgi:predicted lipid-binding transport protein (Tim44 family)